MSIVLEDIFKRFGGQVVVDRVSVEIEDGELFVLLGASGSGKSTLLRLIAGLMPVDEGRILLHGRDVTMLSPQARNVGFVFQNYALFRHMTVAENVEFGLAIRGVAAKARAARRDELLDAVGLGGLGGRTPRQLSGGQQQRVAVARALAFEPSVLLLDEPFGALDVKIRAQLRAVLRRLQRRLGVTTILVTHDQEEAFELADRIAVVERGRLLEIGPPAELYRHPRHEFVAQFVGSATLVAGRWRDGQARVGSLTLPAPVPPEELPPSGRVAVLFRPEDLLLASHPERLAVPLLGNGTVEEVLELGTLRRVAVRLHPQPGVRSLQLGYGEEGIPLQVAELTDGQSEAVAEGQTVWVGIRDFHLMARTEPHLLVGLQEGDDSAALGRAVTILREGLEGAITVLTVAEREEGAEVLLQSARTALTPLAPGATFQARTGDAAETLLREATEGHYDALLVQGSGETRGALVEELTQRSPIPVLVIKGERPAVTRMLLCTAGGEPGKMDVLFGGRLARRVGAQATLLYVAPDGVSPDGAVRHLEQGVQTLLSQGVRAEYKVRQGAVLDEILREAREGAYDMIVVGGHLSTAALPFLENDLATQVVRAADRPVLVVRGELA